MGSFQHTRVRFAAAGLTILEHVCAGEVDGAASPERVDTPVLGFVLEGAGLLRVGRSEVFADPTEIVLMNPGEAYVARHFGCRSGRCAVTLHLAPQLFASIVGRSAIGSLVFSGRFARRTIGRDSSVQVALCRLVDDFRRSDAPGVAPEEAAYELVRRVFASVGEAPRRVPESCVALGWRVRRLLAERFAEPVSLDQLSAELGHSKFHLCRAFRLATGTTIGSYQRRIRVAAALRRLAAGEESLSRLAMDLGFASHSHFSASFRQAVGATPSAVRDGMRVQMPNQSLALTRTPSSEGAREIAERSKVAVARGSSTVVTN